MVNPCRWLLVFPLNLVCVRLLPAHSRQKVFQTPMAACAEQVLKEVRVDTATGLDGIAARVLQKCSHVLAELVFVLAGRIADTGVWPDLWRTHWVVPLRERG